MTDEQKATQENQRTPFDVTSCMAMMGQQGCDCTEMMSQMTVMCCRVQDETEETTATEATQKA